MTVRSWHPCWLASASRAPVDGDGRARARIGSSPSRADKGYSYARCRRLLRQRAIPHTIPPAPGSAGTSRHPTRPPSGLRPVAFDQTIDARRTVVERCINRLKQWRGLATRYEKRAANYRALVVVAAIVIWLGA